MIATTTATGYAVSTSARVARAHSRAKRDLRRYILTPPVIPSADLSVTKTVSSSTPVTGSTIDYTITVNASGNATSTGVVATDTWPRAGLTFVSATSSQGTYASSTGVWTIGEMAPSSSATLDITALVTGNPATRSRNLRPSAHPPPPLIRTRPTTRPRATITVASAYADLVVTKTVDNANPKGGDTVTYTVTVSNLESATSSFVMVHDVSADRLEHQFCDNDAGTGNYNAGTGDWDVGELGPNANATFVVSVTVGSQLDGQSSVTNTATALPRLTRQPSCRHRPCRSRFSPLPPVNPPCTVIAVVVEAEGVAAGEGVAAAVRPMKLALTAALLRPRPQARRFRSTARVLTRWRSRTAPTFRAPHGSPTRRRFRGS